MLMLTRLNTSVTIYKKTEPFPELDNSFHGKPANDDD